MAQSAKKPPLYCPPHQRDCVNGISTDSLDPPHTWPSRSDTLADCHFCLRTDAQLPLVIVNEKRSSPLISAGVLSSEGLCSSHLALSRQLTSALFPTAPARLLQSFRLRFACTPASQQTRSTYRTDGPRAATFLQNVGFFPSHFNEKRSSPLISAGVQSSEGLCCSLLVLCTKRLPLYLPRTERLFTNLPAYASLTLQICKESL